MSLDKILEQREKTHGCYADQAYLSQSLKKIVKNFYKYNNLNDRQKEAIDMIFHKIARIFAGNPEELDHWIDIKGYAELVIRDIRTKK